MLSRVANAIYWMSRYIERAENVARFMDVNINLMLDLPLEVASQWEPLVITTGDDEMFGERYGEATKDNVLQFLAFDKENPNSIISTLTHVRENARSIREIISSEMWEQINKFYFMVVDAAEDPGVLDDPQDFFTRVKMESHLFSGITDSTMYRGEDWHFGRLGRMLERADKTSRIIDVKYYILLPSPEDVGTPIDNIQWAALLNSASALDMYRKKYRRIEPDSVAEFLMLNRDFPRAIHYCIIRAEESLHAITDTPPGGFGNEAERALGKLRSDLNYASIEEIILNGLHEYLDDLQTKLNEVGELIADVFFVVRPKDGKQIPGGVE